MFLNYWLTSIVAILTLVIIVMVANSGFVKLSICLGLTFFLLFLCYLYLISAKSNTKLISAKNLHLQRLRQVGEMSVTISHDINNILTTIIGLSNRLIKQLEEERGESKELVKIKDGAMIISNLVQNILKISKGKLVEKEKINVAEELIDLTPLLQSLINSKSQTIGKIKLSTLLPEQDNYFTKINRAEFWQIVSNLAANAADAMQISGGDILIEVTSFFQENSATILADFSPSSRLNDFTGHFVKLSISDTGSGINQDILAKIFKHSFSTKDMNGMGLGLTNVAKIIHDLKGYIFVTTKIGTGSIFDLYLPMDQSAEKQQNMAMMQENKKDLTRRDVRFDRQILIVEDEESVRDINVMSLINAGYQVIAAANAEEALAIISQKKVKFDLLISDFFIGDMQGTELVQKVKKYLPNIKILLTSGYSEDVIKFTGQDDIPFLAKPYQDNDLINSVKKLLT